MHIPPKVTRAWLLASQVLAVIGIAGVVDDLKSWAKLWEWVLAESKSLPMFLTLAIAELPKIIHSTSAYWRAVSHPVFDFFTAWLPISPPKVVKDILMVSALFATSLIRSQLRQVTLWDDAKDRVKVIARRYAHYPLSGEHFIQWDARIYLLTKGANVEYADERMRMAYSNIERLFGEQATSFCLDLLTDPELPRLREKDHLRYQALKRNTRWIGLLFALALLVVFFDFAYHLHR